MQTYAQRSKSIDPKVTEEFLMNQDGIVDASVWFDRGVLRAHITVDELYRLTEKGLFALCTANVGESYTPCAVVLIPARER